MDRRVARVALASACAVCSARAAARLEVGGAEERVFRSANEAPDGILPPVWLVMQAGSLGGVYAAAAVVRRRSGGRRAARVTAAAGTLVWGGIKGLKPLVGRGRPEEHLAAVRVRGQRQSGLGYPSGHAAVSLTIALTATHGRPAPVRIAALGVAAATGWSRMYVGAHLPLDIAGGFALGVLAGEVADLFLEAADRR